jgi:hypothetical protein
MQVPVLKISSATNTARIGRRRPMFTSFPPVVHHKYRMFTGPQLGYSQDVDSGDRGGLEGKTNRGITAPLKSLGIAGQAELNVIITKNGAQTPT